MAVPGRDSAFGPTLTAAQAAKAAGIVWWGVYVGGPGVYHTWTATEIAVLRQAGLTPLAIWVPTMDLSENPVQSAADAVTACQTAGLFGAVVLDTEARMVSTGRAPGFANQWTATVTQLGRHPVVYAGAGYCPPGVPGFWPYWGSTHIPTAGQAVQYGPATNWGVSVDVDLADPGFPLSSWTAPAPAPPPAPPTPAPSGPAGPAAPIPEGQGMYQPFMTTTGTDGSAYVDLTIPAGCTSLLGGYAQVADPAVPVSAGQPAHHDVDVTVTAGRTDSGVVCQPCVGPDIPAGQAKLRIVGAAPSHFYTGYAIFA